MFETNNKERLIQKQKDCPVKNKKQLNILKEKNITDGNNSNQKIIHSFLITSLG